MTIDAGLRTTRSIDLDKSVRPAVEIRQLPGVQFDEAVATLDGACQEQTYAFNHARYPTSRLEPMVISADGKIVGAALMLIQKLPPAMGAVAVTKWGPALRDNTDPAAYGIVVDALMREYADRRGMLLSIMPRVSEEPDNPHYATLLAKGFRPGELLSDPDRYLIALRLSDEAMRKGFEAKFRNHLNKAERSNLAFERVGADGLEAFTALHDEMTQRRQYVDHSAFATLPALLTHPVAALRAELFMATREGKPIAGLAVFKAGDTAVSLYSATSTEALPLSAGHFINVHAMRWLRDNTQAKWYNLGGAAGNPGLVTFKMGLVGKTGLVRPFPPAATYASNSWVEFTGRSALAARRQVQQLRQRLGR